MARHFLIVLREFALFTQQLDEFGQIVVAHAGFELAAQGVVSGFLQGMVVDVIDGEF